MTGASVSPDPIESSTKTRIKTDPILLLMLSVDWSSANHFRDFAFSGKTRELISTQEDVYLSVT
jgi:hypothetical protein